MHRFACLVVVAGCGSARFHSEYAGAGVALVTPRGAPAAPSAGVPVGQGAYDVRLHFDVPRAQLIEWKVACPGADSEGSVGEPFEAYRNRRLAQLKADRERDRETANAVTSIIVGAVAPNVSASTRNADVQVSGQAVGDVAGTAVASSMDMHVELPPGDVGAGPVETVVHLVTTEPGTCSVSAVADDPNVGGRFELVHIRDLEAEARSREVAIGRADSHARAALTTQLVAFGGDIELRRRQLEAEGAARRAIEAREGVEARARAEASLVIEHNAEAVVRARAEATVQAQREFEEREARVVFEARARLRVVLVSWGADVEYRAHMRAQAEELEASRLRIAMEVRARWRVLLISWGADLEYRAHLAERERLESARREAEANAAEQELLRRHAMELDIAMRTRTQMRAYLVAMGARERPPMPPLRPETPGTAPFDGASWIAGHWTWTGVEWSWNTGGWSDPSGSFGETGGESAVVVETPPPAVIETIPVVTSGPAVVIEPVRDHRTVTPTSAPPVVIEPVRDHRPPTREPERDHRTEPTREPERTHREPVRDHRTSSPDKPKVRDHR